MLSFRSYLPGAPNRKYKLGRSRASSLLSNYSRESEVSPERTQLWDEDEVETEDSRCFFEDEEYETTRVFESPFSDFREESNGSDRQGTTLVATVSRRLYKAVGGR
ncbi:hypothetical protein AAP_04001 [Ascosphaera apis ARSEF 7405]|uniref:Uncharacterized protein n=1 Tax=Ascosphaera apis ARSEF 7405 TaxID=392613 RepID=A0A167XG79_9EURO|nr:hypothetical protein AAP_04001 [Ascosphaera apis ARSEF 7405]